MAAYGTEVAAEGSNSVRSANTTVGDNGVMQLSSMFPDIPLYHIELIYKQNGRDIVSASDMLLNYDLIKDSLTTETEANMKWIEIKKPECVNPSKKKSKKKSGNEVDADVTYLVDFLQKQDMILELLALEESDADLVGFYVKKNGNQVLNAVLDILTNWNKEGGVENQGKDKIHTQLLPNMHSIGKSYADTLRDSLTMHVRKDKMTLINKNMPPDLWTELVGYIKEHRSLNLPSSFYLNAMVWFDYNVATVLYLASRLSLEFNYKANGATDVVVGDVISKFAESSVANECTDNLYIPGSKLSIAPLLESTSASTSASTASSLNNRARFYSSLASSEKNKLVKGYYASESAAASAAGRQILDCEQQRLMQRLQHMAISDSQVDLHSLSVKNAIELANSVLNEWWYDELKERQNNGVPGTKGSAVYLDPLIIITGKGTHSAGNIPKIKNGVKKLLNRGYWIYDEQSASFTVYGLRK